MKRKVKSKEDLRKLALRRGATVTDERGRKFNADGKAMQVRSKPKAKPPPEPKGPTSEEVLATGLESIALKLGASQDVTQGTLTHLRDQIDAMAATPHIPDQPRHGWVFDVRRNDDDLIDQIIASPKRI